MPAASRARPGFELGLDACAFLFLPVLALASKGMAALASVAGALALGLVLPEWRAAWRTVSGTGLLLAAVVVWGLVSALWAVEPGRSVLIALRLAGLFAAGLALVAAAERVAAPRRLIMFFIAGLVLALALTVAQFATEGALTGRFNVRPFRDPLLNQVENGFVLLLLPLTAVLILRRRFLPAVVVAALTAAVIYRLVGDAAQAAFAVGLGAAMLYGWKRRGIARLAASVSVVVILSAPLIFPRLIERPAIQHWAQGFKFSMWHRLEIWSFVGARIGEHPWFGWGLDSSRAIPGGDALTPGGPAWLPLHPHNVPLQAWLELGVPGALLLALFVARLWLALPAKPWPPLYAAAAAGSLAAAQAVALGGYGMWQEWWIGTEFLAAFLILAMGRLAQSSAVGHPPDLRHRPAPPRQANLAQPIPEARSGSIS